MESKKQILMRMYLVYVSTGIFAFIVLFQVFRIQFVEGDVWKEKAKNRTIKERNIEATRGDIYSIDGSLLATSIPIYEIRMDLGTPALTDDVFKKNVDSLAICFADYYKDKPAKEYKKALIKARKDEQRYFLVNKKKVGYLDMKRMKKFPIFRLGKNKGGFIPVMDTAARVMPYGMLCERTIGYVNKNSNVFLGLEGGFNEQLAGVGGVRLMQRISGDIWMPLNDDNEIEPKDGSDIYSTIDINLQDVAEHALQKQLDSVEADHGCVIVMEVATGEIRAIANLKHNANGTYSEAYNYAIGEANEPGSTFKLASLIAAIEDGYVDLDDLVNTENGSTHYCNAEMKDSHEGGGTFTVKEIFEHSSNVGVSKIINKNYAKNPQKFVDHLYKMGLATKMNIEIPGEGDPYIKNTKDKTWSCTSLPWMSIGYEMKITPLQMLTFYNAVANNGAMVKPRFIREIRKDGKVVKAFAPEIMVAQICSPSTIVKAKQMLEGVVENGTAKNLKGFHIKIAGKTGTAQANYTSRGSQKMQYRASFVGYFPAEAPKYSCIVVINNPTKIYYGNVVAGPIFREIAEKVYSTRMEMHKELIASSNPFGFGMKSGYSDDMNIIARGLKMNVSGAKSENTPVSVFINGNTLSSKNIKTHDGYMPNVVGMTLKDAIYILENLGLKVIIKGKGTISNQSISPEARIRKGEAVTLTLS